MNVLKWSRGIANKFSVWVAGVFNMKVKPSVKTKVLDDSRYKTSRKSNTNESFRRLQNFRGKLPADFIWCRDDENARR